MKYNFENFTEQLNRSSLSEAPQYPVIWVAGFIANIILIILSLCLFVTAFAFGNICIYFRNESVQNDRKRLLQMATIASALTLPRLILTHLLFWLGYNNKSNQLCEIILDISVIAYMVPYVMVYFFIWLRQQFGNKQPAFSSMYTKAFKVVSYLCFCFIIVGAVAVILMFVEPLSHKSTLIGCYNYESDAKTSLNLPFSAYYIFYAVMVFSQISLIVLLAYPLVCHSKMKRYVYTRNKESTTSKTIHPDKNICFQKSKKRTDLTAVPTQTENVNNKMETTEKNIAMPHQMSASFKALRKRTLQEIKRNVICALGCLLTNMTANAIVGLIIKGTQPRYFTGTVYDVSMVLNVVFFFRSFENCKTIFCSNFDVKKIFSF